MKALYLEECGNPRVADLPVPGIAEDEVLLRVKACAICGSDVHGYGDRSGRRRPPLIMGHEAAGCVEKAGSRVTRFQSGDRAVLNSSLFCGDCWFCRRGMQNLCESARVFGVNCDTYKLDGAMAEYVAVPERALYPLPDSISYVEGAMIEPLSIALHAVNRTPLCVGDVAVVVGSGTIGMMLMKVLKRGGVRSVIAMDIADDKLKAAEKAGADHLINSSGGDWQARFRRICPRGADRAFEAVGFGVTVNNAIDLARKGGSVTLVGNAQPKAELDFQKIVLKELTVVGTYACANEYATAIDLIASGAVNVMDVVSIVAPLEEGKQWLDRLSARESGLTKVVLTIE